MLGWIQERMSGGMWGAHMGTYGELNEAGRELLTLLSINGATMCNNWFQADLVTPIAKIQEVALH